MRIASALILILVLCGTLCAEDSALEAAKGAYAKDVESIKSKADQDIAKAKAKLMAAYQAGIKRAMSRNDADTTSKLKLEMDALGGGGSPATPDGNADSTALISADMAQTVLRAYRKFSNADWDTIPGTIYKAGLRDLNVTRIDAAPGKYLVVAALDDTYSAMGGIKKSYRVEQGFKLRFFDAAGALIREVALADTPIIEIRDKVAQVAIVGWLGYDSDTVRVKVVAIK